MKFFIFFFSILFISCSIGTNNNSQEKKRITEEESYQALLLLEKSLVQTDLNLNSKVANSLYYKSLDFLKAYPKSEQKESVLVLAAKCADGLNLTKENIGLIEQLLILFPKSKNAPNYLYNKGKIYEEKLNNVSKAKECYKELILKYPNSALGQSMQLYLNFLDKSEKEQVDFLKN